MLKIAIIGGGAAGLMATASVLESGFEGEIFLLDRNDGLGKKVIISGGGRCNVTTGIKDVKTVLSKYPRGSEFLRSAMTAFPPAAVYAWFETHGVPLKRQPDERVFPQSDDGHDVVRAFERLFTSRNVKIMPKTHVTAVRKIADRFELTLRDRSEPLIVDRLIITTGGQAYRQTGSTGDGYAFAMALGHTITSLAPSLNSFYTAEKWPAELSGLSFKLARLTAECEGKPSFLGPFLFTHKGLSGPAVFALSSLVAFQKYDAKTPLSITIDLMPSIALEPLRKTINEFIGKNPTKSFVNVLANYFPRSIVELGLRELSIVPKPYAGEVGKKDLIKFLSWAKAIPLSVIGRGAGDEFVTAGGVNTDEVNPETMESKICPGLFFAGEVLNIDGFTGGFNLQASWATGRKAGFLPRD